MNPHLSGVDAFLVGVVSVEALIACYVQWQVRRVSSRAQRGLATGTAALALMFAICYNVLLWTDVNPQAFQSVLRGMGVVSWLIVWILPARIKLQARAAEKIVEGVEQRLMAK